MQDRVLSTIKQIDQNYLHSSLQSKKQRSIANRSIWRSRVNDNFRILWGRVHSAKALEFPVVFLIGLADQYLPYINQDSDIKLEDELQKRKLFYVSMTRAAERLYLLHPQRNRSRFLHDLDESTIRRVSC